MTSYKDDFAQRSGQAKLPWFPWLLYLLKGSKEYSSDKRDDRGREMAMEEWRAKANT